LSENRLSEKDQAPDFVAKPVFGKHLSLSEHAENRPVVLVFVPSLGAPMSRGILAQMQQSVSDFDLAGVSLYAITRSSPEVAQDFVPRHHLLFPTIVDAGGEIFSKYGVGGLCLKGAVRSLNPRRIRKGITVWSHGVGRFERGFFAPTAVVSIQRGGQVFRAHYSDSLWPQLSFEEILAALTTAA